MRFFQFTTFYGPYLNAFYQENARLLRASYQDISQALFDDGFSEAHFFSLALRDRGYESMYVVANDPISQNAWRSENLRTNAKRNFINSVTTGGWGAVLQPSLLDILVQQISTFEPDVLYIQDISAFDSRFIRLLPKKPKLIIGWRAATMPESCDLTETDIYVSNFKPYFSVAKQLGAKDTEFFMPGFPSRLAEKLKSINPENDVGFLGQLSSEHKTRISTLLEVSKWQLQAPRDFSFRLNFDGGQQFPTGLMMHNQGSKWGMEMYEALRKNKINLNIHIDLAGENAGNMRLFEATGLGTFLLTDNKNSAQEYFHPGKEIETFSSILELKDKILFYLENEDERERIATAGQARCLVDYSLNKSAEKLDEIINKFFKDKNKILNHQNKTQVRNLDLAESKFQLALDLFKQQKHEQAIKQIAAIKGTHSNKLPLDKTRAKIYLQAGKIADAYEAAKESLRFYPDDKESSELLQEIQQKMPPPMLPGDPEFRQIYSKIRQYTMVGVERLYSLYSNAKRICEEDLPGNFVECGVAAGGSSAMLAYLIKKYSKRERKLFSFDTFEGMPEAGEKDAAFGVKAEDTGWGKGTCAAPLESLQEVAECLEAWDRIVAVKGLFADTLFQHKQAIGRIAFLHADGDWYESTMDIFNNLYESVVDHGFIQIDDYGYWQGCKQAIHQFEARCGVKFPLKVIDATGVSFTKTLPRDHFVAKLLPTVWNFPEKGSSVPQSPIVQQGLKPRLNLGCGSQVHPEWTNVDIMPRHPGVINHDLNKRLPFADASFEVVYHSHVLEHLTKEQGKAFVGECYRVLKPGGILRVVVPDLEMIARLYLDNLDKAEAGDGTASNRHEWMLLELLDQMVRETSGGEMGRYFQLNPMPAEDFVIERFGHQVLEVIKLARANPASRNRPVPPLPRHIDAMEAARFRQCGEIHKWMYDRRSLSRLLAESGFDRVAVKKAGESSIPEFGKYFLDRMPDGSTRKPDSLFMEAFKL